MWVPLGMFAMIATIIWFGSRVNQIRLMKQAEVQNGIFAEFQSGRELAELMETEPGQRFLSQWHINPHAAILRSMMIGIVLFILGSGIPGDGDGRRTLSTVNGNVCLRGVYPPWVVALLAIALRPSTHS